MKPGKTLILICIDCGTRFSTSDVGAFLFFPECMTCYKCLKRLSTYPTRASCFGSELYNREAAECSTYCQDRLPCRLFAEGHIVRLIQMTAKIRAESLRCITEVQKREARFKKTSKSNPFTRGSIARPLFVKMREADGMSRVEFDQYLEEMGGDHAYYLRTFRKQFKNGVEWVFEESGGKLRVKLT